MNIRPNRNERGLLTEFDGSITPTPITIPIQFEDPINPTTLGTAKLFVDDATDRVLLHATIPWSISIEDNVEEAIEIQAKFEILRNGQSIYRVGDSVAGRSDCSLKRVTSLTFLDIDHSTGLLEYELQVTELCGIVPEGEDLAFDTDSFVIFTAAEIEANNPPRP